MMNKTHLANWNEDTERMVIFTENAPEHLVGKKLPIVSPEGFPNFIMKFDAKLNLETLVATESTDDSYEDCPDSTITDLIEEGILREWHPYRKIELNLDNKLYKRGRAFKVRNIQTALRIRGFNVSTEAIRYIAESNSSGFKSGFRDEKNGVHLFMACGDNVLVASSLIPMCADWQTTYYC